MTLKEMIDKNDLEESVISKFTRDILKGLKHLHDHDIIHGNLRAANVFTR